MSPILRNILSVILGWLVGSAVNMGLVQLGHTVWPIDGLDPNDLEALAEVMSTAEPKYFLFPFLAHALGTLVGALVAALIAANRKMTFAMVVGAIFLLGGIAINMMIPGPTWFAAMDIALAYLLMAWIGGMIASRN